MESYTTTNCRLEKETLRQHIQDWQNNGSGGRKLMAVAPVKIDPASGLVTSYEVIWRLA